MRHATIGVSGFTLLEMAVALAVGSMVCALGAVTLSAGADFRARSSFQLKQLQDRQAIERTLRLEWSNRIGVLKLEDQILEFHTTTPARSEGGVGVATVQYRCTEQAQGVRQFVGQVVRTNAASESAAGRAAGSVGEALVLAADLSECRISLLANPAAGVRSAKPSWVQRWTPKATPTRLLRLELNGQGQVLPELVFLNRGA